MASAGVAASPWAYRVALACSQKCQSWKKTASLLIGSSGHFHTAGI